MLKIITIHEGQSEDCTIPWTLPAYLDEMSKAGFDDFKIISADDSSVSIRYSMGPFSSVWREIISETE